MDHLAETTKILFLGIFDITAIIFVVYVVQKIIKKFIRKISGKNELDL